MKFDRTTWKKNDYREWTLKRIAAAKRKVQREKDKTPLFPELSPLQSVAQRIQEVDEAEVNMVLRFRAYEATTWRAGRRDLQRLHPITKAGVLEIWNRKTWGPRDATSFISLVREYSTKHPYRSPWAHLRFMHMLRRFKPVWDGMKITNPVKFTEHY